MGSHQGQGKAEETDDETAFQQGPCGYGPRVFSKVRRSFVSCSTTAVEMLGFDICSVDEPRAFHISLLACLTADVPSRPFKC